MAEVTTGRHARKEDIAKALDVHWRTVLNWAKGGCPHTKLGRRAIRFNLDEVRAWLEEMGRTGRPGRPTSGGAVRVDKDRADLQLTIERCLMTKLQREQIAGKVHDAGKCRERRLAQIHALKGELMALPRSVSAELASQERKVIEGILNGRIEALLTAFAQGYVRNG